MSETVEIDEQQELGGRVFLYARVSTTDQDTTVQEQQLQKLYPKGILSVEKASATTINRPQLDGIRTMIQSGDKLVVCRIDRLARNVLDLNIIVKELREKGASLKILDKDIDTSTASGMAFLQMLGVFAEFENNLRKERQAAGIAKAKAEGRYKGTEKRIDREQVKQMLDDGVAKMQIAKRLGIGRASVYRIIDEINKDDKGVRD